MTISLNETQSTPHAGNPLIKSNFDWQLYLLSLILLVLVNLNQWQGWTQAIDFSLYDNHVRSLSTIADEEIIIVEIDEQSLSLLGDWPWPRSYHGQMIDILTQADAEVIAYNVVFSHADAFNENDKVLADAIEKSGRTILPLYFDRLLKENDVTEVLPAEAFRKYAGLGHVNSYLDDDGTLRSIRLVDQFLDRQWSHFSFASYLFDRPYSAVIDHGLKEAYIPFVNQGDFQRVSFVDVLTGLVPAKKLSQRTVFVGVTATSIGDPLLTPVDDSGRQSPAVDINANVYQALKNNDLIQSMSPYIGLLINTFLIIALLYLLPRSSGLQQLLIIFVGMISLWGLSYFLIKQGYWFRSAGLMLVVVIIPFVWNLLRLSRLFTYFRQQIQQLKEQQSKEVFNLPGHGFLKSDEELAALLALMKIEHYKLFALGQTDSEPELTVVKNFEIQIGQQYKTLVINFDEFTALEHRKVSLLNQFLNIKGVEPLSSDGENFATMDVFSKQLSLIDNFQQRHEISHSLFEMSIEGISSGIFVSDLTGKVLFSNKALSILTNNNIGELKDLLHCVHLVKKDWVTVLREVILVQQPLTLEANANDKDLSISVRCIDGQSGLAPLLVFNITDVSVIKQANRSRNEMIDFLSHDLRSPMASLQAMVNQAREVTNKTPATISEIIDKVDHYSQRGLDFAEQFLELAKVEAEEEIQWYDVDLYSVSQNAMDSLYHQAQEKSIKILLESIDECWVISNGDLLERIILNILSNAIKYSPSNSEVALTISMQGEEGNNQKIRIEIADQGPGIPLDLMENLFKPYQRGKDSNTQQAKGIGLGLRFVDVALKRLNSQIEFESSKKGTTFYFYLALESS
jgi:signal transduction histidine kinase/CHASE2 domain-containing sensor protein